MFQAEASFAGLLAVFRTLARAVTGEQGPKSIAFILYDNTHTLSRETPPYVYHT